MYWLQLTWISEDRWGNWAFSNVTVTVTDCDVWIDDRLQNEWLADLLGAAMNSWNVRDETICLSTSPSNYSAVAPAWHRDSRNERCSMCMWWNLGQADYWSVQASSTYGVIHPHGSVSEIQLIRAEFDTRTYTTSESAAHQSQSFYNIKTRPFTALMHSITSPNL